MSALAIRDPTCRSRGFCSDHFAMAKDPDSLIPTLIFTRSGSGRGDCRRLGVPGYSVGSTLHAIDLFATCVLQERIAYSPLRKWSGFRLDRWPSTAGCYHPQREYPQPPPPSKNNTKRTIKMVSMFHLCWNRGLLRSSNPQRSCFPHATKSS